MRNVVQMTNRKGLSDVITTVLIILLVLAAVVLIWGFIRGGLGSGGETIDLQTQCMKLSDGLEPKSCEILADNNTKVVVQWKSGDVTLTDVRAIVTSATGANTLNDSKSAPNLLSTVQIGVNASTLPDRATASVAGKIKTKTGTEGWCPEASVKVTCVKATP